MAGRKSNHIPGKAAIAAAASRNDARLQMARCPVQLTVGMDDEAN